MAPNPLFYVTILATLCIKGLRSDCIVSEAERNGSHASKCAGRAGVIVGVNWGGLRIRPLLDGNIVPQLQTLRKENHDKVGLPVI